MTAAMSAAWLFVVLVTAAVPSDPVEALLSPQTKAELDRLLRVPDADLSQEERRLREALGSDPIWATTYLATRANEVAKEGDANLALGLFREASRLGPMSLHRAWAARRTGHLLEEAGHADLAAEVWTSLLDAYPSKAWTGPGNAGPENDAYYDEFHQAALDLAQLEADRGATREALRWYASAESKYPHATYCGSCQWSRSDWIREKGVELEAKLPPGEPRPFTDRPPESNPMLIGVEAAKADPTAPVQRPPKGQIGDRPASVPVPSPNEPWSHHEWSVITAVSLTLLAGMVLASRLRARENRARPKTPEQRHH
ncbi:MAG: hypothetical protein IPH13_11135 [Planctomycetes bacterium]|nr:hypothetical protein [Planctomycetota bacterium]